MSIAKSSILALTLLVLSAPSASQNLALANPHTSVMEGFVVTTADITDRPYLVLGRVTAVASTVDWSHPLNTDIDAKLRKKAQKMGADAVVRVVLSDGPSGAMDWGGLKGTGLAIKFTGPQTSNKP